MVRINDELALGNSFEISNYGLYKALIFTGDASFIERCRNFSINSSLIRNIDSFVFLNFTPKGECWYLLAPESRIQESFQKQFTWEIIANKEFKSISRLNEENDDFTINFDENEVNATAENLTKIFIENTLVRSNYFQWRTTNPSECFEYNYKTKKEQIQIRGFKQVVHEESDKIDFQLEVEANEEAFSS